MKKADWYNNNGVHFASKADAFQWMNETDSIIDSIKLYESGTLHYTKNFWGIFDEQEKYYLKGKLPVERY